MTDSKFFILKTLSIITIVCSLFFGIGCIEYRQNTKAKAPIVEPDTKEKTYTLKLSNGYETSASYAMTEDLANRYLKHLNSCPIALRIRTYEEYKDQYISKVVKKYKKYESIDDFAGANTAGQHVRGWPVKGWPDYFLFVRASPSPHAVMSTYFHELGHYECNRKLCPNCKADGKSSMTELHAIMNELESSIEYDFPEVLKYSFVKYYGWTLLYDDYIKYQKYGDAVLEIQESDLWKKVKKYCKKHDITPPKYEKPEKPKKQTITIYFKLAA